MKRIRTIAFAAAMCALACIPTEAKKVLDHTSFDDWKSVRINAVSDAGQWVAFTVNPQEGDGRLVLRNVKTGQEIVVNRGANPAFTADGKWAVALIQPYFQATRKARIAKKSGLDLPQPSLAIVNLTTGAIDSIPAVQNFKIGAKGGDWVAFATTDTTYIKPKQAKDRKSGKPLVVRHLPTGSQKVLKWVKEYNISKDGKFLAANIVKPKSDTVAVNGMGLLTLPDTVWRMLDTNRPFYGNVAFTDASDRMAFVASNDSAETGTRKAEVLLADLRNPGAKPVAVPLPQRGAKSQTPLYFNQYTTPHFSKDGKRLMAGVAPAVAPNDTTIVPFEVATLDIWRWDAPLTPPQENNRVERLRRRTLPALYDLGQTQLSGILLTADPEARTSMPRNEVGNYVLLSDPGENIVDRQWNYSPDVQVSLLDITTGQVKPVATVPDNSASLSPDGKYVIWYSDRNFYVYDVATGQTRCISDAIPFPVWNEDQDTPARRSPYGMPLWTKGDDSVLIYDRFDIWSVDPAGKREPINLTAGDGRANSRRYRYITTDREQTAIDPAAEALLAVFNYTDKQNGLATMRLNRAAAPLIRTIEPYQFNQIHKAADAPVYAFEKANFNTSPDVYISAGENFGAAKKVSDINPQMKDYNWGTAELVKWYSYQGHPTEGVLYKPEDFDPTKKYPMLVVFYETNSENLYKHYNMEPSWSWVNYPFYVSRGYVILVPDVHYFAGIPGESAYDYICSGVDELCKKYDWIDRDRIGIDGQSWGGYQTAFLVTRINMFACAGSGAPVANMTSAFGGIRWESGDSRQGQYEQGQSRIGRNLWEAPEFYIANSPVFHADRVNTPLLIMHNDADGAVPWYQGIEMFMALRRLKKPVWMLQYNNEAHNLRERRNRKDITIRLQQFFDHYLKGDPMPKWMKEGVPSIRKGQEWGTELTSK